jgi:hypothetical protein
MQGSFFVAQLGPLVVTNAKVFAFRIGRNQPAILPEEAPKSSCELMNKSQGYSRKAFCNQPSFSDCIARRSV